MDTRDSRKRKSIEEKEEPEIELTKETSPENSSLPASEHRNKRRMGFSGPSSPFKPFKTASRPTSPVNTSPSPSRPVSPTTIAERIKERKQSMELTSSQPDEPKKIQSNPSDINISGLEGSTDQLNPILTNYQNLQTEMLPLGDEPFQEKRKRSKEEDPKSEEVAKRRKSSGENVANRTRKSLEIKDYKDKLPRWLNSSQCEEIAAAGFKPDFLPTSISAEHTVLFDLNKPRDVEVLNILKDFTHYLKDEESRRNIKIITGTTEKQGLALLLFKKTHADDTTTYHYTLRSILEGNVVWKPEMMKSIKPSDEFKNAYALILKDFPEEENNHPEGFKDIPHFEKRIWPSGTSGHNQLTLGDHHWCVIGVGEFAKPNKGAEKINDGSGTFFGTTKNVEEPDGLHLHKFLKIKYANEPDKYERTVQLVNEVLAEKFFAGGTFVKYKKRKTSSEKPHPNAFFQGQNESKESANEPPAKTRKLGRS